MERLILEYFEEILNGKDLHYVQKKNSEKNINRSEILQSELSRLSAKEQRIKLAYENEVDTLEEYRENKQRLQNQRTAIMQELSSLDCGSPVISKEDVLARIQSVYDVIRNPDVSYDIKGNFIRIVINEIVYDKNTGKAYFDVIIS